MEFAFAYRRYHLPFRHVVRTAHGPWTVREGLIVRVTDHEGVVGWGEVAPIPWFGTESVEEAETACRELGNRVESQRLPAWPERLRCTRHAITQAVDRAAPVRGDENAYLSVAALLPAGRDVLAAIPARTEAGFRVFKWKVGVGDPADELALLDDVCAALPSGAKLRLDANGAWDRRRAERWLERCAERPVEFVEQPVEAGGDGAEDLLLGLAGDWPTPLALDESIANEHDVVRWLEAGWPGVFVLKPSLLGDIDGTVRRLERAKAAVVFSSALETAVGAKAALRTAFSWRGERRALGFGVWPLFADARCNGPAAAPFVRHEDVERINPEEVWNALN